MKMLVAAYQISNLIQDVIKATDGEGRFTLDVDAVVQNMSHVSLSLKSSGVGAVGEMVYNLLSFESRIQMKQMLQGGDMTPSSPDVEEAAY